MTVALMTVALMSVAMLSAHPSALQQSSQIPTNPRLSRQDGTALGQQLHNKKPPVHRKGQEVSCFVPPFRG
jgi:hypothetical protein